MVEKEKKVMGISAPDEAWLSQVEEEIIEPDLPIIDPHHHLWIRPGHTYLMPELVKDVTSGHNIVASVFTECHSMYRNSGPDTLKSLGETEFVAGCAAMSDSGVFGDAELCKGITGNVDLRLGEDCRELLEQHIDRAGGRFRGTRCTAAWHDHEKVNSPAPFEHMLLDDNVQAGAQVMASLDLTLDIWVFHPQLEEVALLAAKFPDLKIVLNHTGVPILGGPYRGKRDEVFAAWRSGMQKIAEQQNIYLKLGAIPIRTPGDGIDRSVPPGSEEIAASWAPWVHECIELAGAGRCMFESNFPVQKLFSSYPVTWNAFKRLAAGASDDEKRLLFHDTAAEAYRL